MNTVSTATPVQLNLVDEVCPRCMKPESEVGELHEDDQLCATCETEFVDEMAKVFECFGLG